MAARTGVADVGDPRSTWGPRVEHAHWLRSERALDLIAAHVDTERGAIADALTAMRDPRRYLLLDRLARTPRASVFAAIDQLLAREVALKVLRAADDERRCARLLAEMQAITRFRDPHIVLAHEFGIHHGQPYMVMELCDDNLERWARGRPMADVLGRLIEAGRGLEVMHRAGYVHGDIKPANVLVVDGVAKLGDLELAGEPGYAARVRGTLGYIAPEVAEGERLPASDVFSFAAMAWVLLLGHPPFGEPPPSASTSAAMMVQLKRARDGPLELHAQRGVWPRIAAALRPGLAFDAGDRPPLPELLAQLQLVVRPRGRLRRFWGLLVTKGAR